MPGSTSLAVTGPREPTGNKAGDRAASKSSAPHTDEKFGRREQKQTQKDKEAR